MIQREVEIISTKDGTKQPSLYFKAKGENRPLLVGLHTWSFNRFNQINNMLPYAEKYDFNLLLPEFRGPNKPENPICREACGSELAMQDIIDAIDWAIAEEGADSSNVLLLGLSGGGHMAMMMAGYAPERFKAIGAVVPITDLAAWTEENPNYRKSVFACCTEERDELLRRSPISYIHSIAKANIKIFHGKYDSVVPVSHSLRFYSEMMKLYPNSRVFLDIFDGGHTIDMEASMYWLISQYKKANIVNVTG